MLNKDKFMELIEKYRTAGGREEHWAYKDMIAYELELLECHINMLEVLVLVNTRRLNERTV